MVIVVVKHQWMVKDSDAKGSFAVFRIFKGVCFDELGQCVELIGSCPALGKDIPEAGLCRINEINADAQSSRIDVVRRSLPAGRIFLRNHPPSGRLSAVSLKPHQQWRCTVPNVMVAENLMGTILPISQAGGPSIVPESDLAGYKTHGRLNLGLMPLGGEITGNDAMDRFWPYPLQ